MVRLQTILIRKFALLVAVFVYVGTVPFTNEEERKYRQAHLEQSKQNISKSLKESFQFLRLLKNKFLGETIKQGEIPVLQAIAVVPTLTGTA